MGISLIRSHTSKDVNLCSGLSPSWGSPDSGDKSPQEGGSSLEEARMKTLRRFILALGSLAVIALAGGAHWRVPG
jgi:hypothetical protein